MSTALQAEHLSRDINVCVFEVPDFSRVNQKVHDRARVPGDVSKGPLCPKSSFPVIVANIRVIEGTQQAVKIPIAIASEQETRTSVRENSVSQKLFEFC